MLVRVSALSWSANRTSICFVNTSQFGVDGGDLASRPGRELGANCLGRQGDVLSVGCCDSGLRNAGTVAASPCFQPSRETSLPYSPQRLGSLMSR